MPWIVKQENAHPTEENNGAAAVDAAAISQFMSEFAFNCIQIADTGEQTENKSFLIDIKPDLISETSRTKPIINEDDLDYKFDENEEYTCVNEIYTCMKCNKTFKKKSKCKYHYRIHLNVRPFKCHVCEKTFKLKTTLNNHVRGHESFLERVRFNCSICGKEFMYQSMAKCCEKGHAGLFAFQCKLCEKGFHYKSGLETHMQVKHNAVKETCPVCEKIFANKINLKYHIRLYHNADKKLPTFKCEQCFKVYNTRKLFNRHLRSHEGFPCDICGKICAYEHGLKSHMLIHRGERPWSCDICGKDFNKKTILNVHLRTHTNEKPYGCTFCGKRFTQRSPLVIHTRLHTGERPYHCQLCEQSFICKNYLRIHMQCSHNCSNF